MEKKQAENSGCCKDESKHIKLTVDQKSNKVVEYKFNVIENESRLAFITYPDDLNKQELFISNLIDNAPRGSCIATYIRNRNFRIWYYSHHAIALFRGNHFYLDKLLTQFLFQVKPDLVVNSLIRQSIN